MFPMNDNSDENDHEYENGVENEDGIYDCDDDDFGHERRKRQQWQ